MHVIAIGPQGGKIVGYHHGDIKKPIYAGSDDAKKLEMATPHGSPAASAAGHGVHVGVHPTRHDMATVSWKHGDQGAAKAWLDAHGGTKSLPGGVEVHKTSTHTVMHVPREWAEKGTAPAMGQAEISAQLEAALAGSTVTFWSKGLSAAATATKLPGGKWADADGDTFNSGLLAAAVYASGKEMTLSIPKLDKAAWEAELGKMAIGTSITFTSPAGLTTAHKNGGTWSTNKGHNLDQSTLALALAYSDLHSEPGTPPIKIAPAGPPAPTAAAPATAPAQPAPIPIPPPVAKPVTPAVAPTAPSQTAKTIAPPVEVDKASLTVWGCDSWQASGRHPVTTPDGPGFLLGHVHTKMNHDMLTGHMLVEVGGVAKKYVASQVVPQAGAPLQGAWAHPQVKAWSSPEVTTMLDTILAANLTTQSGVSVGTSAATVFDKLAAEGVACFVTGGMVRDAIQGKKGNDIDFGFTGSGAQRLRAVAKKLGLPLAAHSAADLGNGSGLVEFGHDEKTVEEGKAQGKGFTNLGGCLSSTPPPPAIRGSDMYSDLLARDFTCNALSYDPKNKVILDPSGTGVADAASKTLRFAAPPEMWDDWSDRNPSIVARYYKFRSRGYEPADQAHADYIKTKGKALVEQGALPGWAKAELKKYKKEIVADFGLAWFNAHV